MRAVCWMALCSLACRRQILRLESNGKGWSLPLRDAWPGWEQAALAVEDLHFAARIEVFEGWIVYIFIEQCTRFLVCVKLKQQVFAECSCFAGGTTLSRKLDVSISVAVDGLKQIKSLWCQNSFLSCPGVSRSHPSCRDRSESEVLNHTSCHI